MSCLRGRWTLEAGMPDDVLNPATLLPNENTEVDDADEVEHDCLEVTELCTKPRPDIKDTQLEENDYIGSCLRDSVGVLRAGYAVCTITGILEASWLERVYSAQMAQLVAPTRACHTADKLKVSTYTDRRYGFGIVHDFGQLCSQRGFLTSSGSPMKNGERIKELLHAIQLPHEIAVVKCSAHVKSQDFGGHSDPGGKIRQGQRPREHRQQAGGAPMGILTAAVQPRSETENRRCTAGFPLPWGILHGGAACRAAMGIPTPILPSCSWRLWGVVGPP
ncbi:hypothetical protein NDU88_006425 [Pleurodeles waltl]|uniref:RNase H type-1 domain-containing protein n=1 Tax=Pleurodeles waltl TaxID=8319 RepID=A0AAV7TDX0_PLEWA|nr:hypothetical protein NDU88_006425 [Pleurodeles waltl]